MARFRWWDFRRTADHAPHRFPGAEITWKCSQRRVWVATHSAEFVGMVEELDGTFVANDTLRGTYNTYRTLGEAMQAFETPIADAEAGLSPRRA